MTVATRFTSSLLYILIMGKSCLSPTFLCNRKQAMTGFPHTCYVWMYVGYWILLQIAIMTDLFTLPIHFWLLISLCVILHLPFIFLHFLNVFRMSLLFYFQCRSPYFICIIKLYNLRKRVVSARIRITVSPGIWNFKVKGALKRRQLPGYMAAYTKTVRPWKY